MVSMPYIVDRFNLLDMLSDLVIREFKATFSRSILERSFDLSRRLALTSSGIVCSEVIVNITLTRK
jgi:hypothetical protein